MSCYWPTVFQPRPSSLIVALITRIQGRVQVYTLEYNKTFNICAHLNKHFCLKCGRFQFFILLLGQFIKKDVAVTMAYGVCSCIRL